MDDYKAGRIKHASPDFVTSYLFATMVRQTVGKADGRSVLGSHLLLSTRIFCRTESSTFFGRVVELLVQRQVNFGVPLPKPTSHDNNYANAFLFKKT